MSAKYCPFKMAHALPTPIMAAFDWYCEESDCAWWEDYTEMCSIKTPAFLQAIGAERAGATIKEGNND